jgi:hypothetical protein
MPHEPDGLAQQSRSDRPTIIGGWWMKELPRRLRRPAHQAVIRRDAPTLWADWEPSPPCVHLRSRLPCTQRAIHTGPERS